MGNRLKQAREEAGLTYAQLAAKLPPKARLGASRLCRIEQSGQPHRTKAATVEALAQVLRVTAPWLSGEPMAYPIDGLDLDPRPGELLDDLLRSNLRGATFVHRCLVTAQRDYEQDTGEKAATSAEWPRMAHWLAYRFWYLPELAQNAANLLPPWPHHQVAKPGQRTEPAYSYRKAVRDPYEQARKPGQWTDTAFRYWSDVLDPWWQGRVGLDYKALATLRVERQAGERRGSPRDALDAIRGEWHLPGQLTGLGVGFTVPARNEEDEIARRTRKRRPPTRTKRRTP